MYTQRQTQRASLPRVLVSGPYIVSVTSSPMQMHLPAQLLCRKRYKIHHKVRAKLVCRDVPYSVLLYCTSIRNRRTALESLSQILKHLNTNLIAYITNDMSVHTSVGLPASHIHRLFKHTTQRHQTLHEGDFISNRNFSNVISIKVITNKYESLKFTPSRENQSNTVLKGYSVT